MLLLPVMAGLVPAIPIHLAPPCPTHRDRRDKLGDDAAKEREGRVETTIFKLTLFSLVLGA